MRLKRFSGLDRVHVLINIAISGVDEKRSFFSKLIQLKRLWSSCGLMLCDSVKVTCIRLVNFNKNFALQQESEA